MSRLISITAIAALALLAALLSMDISRPGSPANERAAAGQIPPHRILHVAGRFHVRLLVAAGERVDSTVLRSFGEVAGRESFANKQVGPRPSSVR